jgi:nuclear-control-of-ATPase protein 2
MFIAFFFFFFFYSVFYMRMINFDFNIYIGVYRFGEELFKDPDNSLPSLLVTINGLFSNLEASIGHLHAMSQVAV